MRFYPRIGHRLPGGFYGSIGFGGFGGRRRAAASRSSSGFGLGTFLVLFVLVVMAIVYWPITVGVLAVGTVVLVSRVVATRRQNARETTAIARPAADPNVYLSTAHSATESVLASASAAQQLRDRVLALPPGQQASHAADLRAAWQKVGVTATTALRILDGHAPPPELAATDTGLRQALGDVSGGTQTLLGARAAADVTRANAFLDGAVHRVESSLSALEGFRPTVLATVAAPVLPLTQSPAAQIPVPTGDAAERLRTLNSLRDAGLISPSEYAAKHAEIIQEI